MRRALLWATLLLAGGARAQTDAPTDWRLGATVGVLLHEVASGNRAPLPTAEVRLARVLSPRWRLELDYGLGLTWGGAVLGASSQLHRLSLRPEFAIPLRATSVVLALGPAVTAAHTDLYQDATRVTGSTDVRAGASAGAAFEVRLGGTNLRLGMDVLWFLDRVDFVVGLGALFDLGGRR